jgi:methylenetetrahydrofolate dehydrogenase (NADP+)/methenyltetrahydrofolate cyclohydrolase
MAAPLGWGSSSPGHDPASEVYVGHKVKAGTSAGFRVDLERLPETASLADALALVERLNASPNHDGILVQSPLPKGDGPRRRAGRVRHHRSGEGR